MVNSTVMETSPFAARFARCILANVMMNNAVMEIFSFLPGSLLTIRAS